MTARFDDARTLNEIVALLRDAQPPPPTAALLRHEQGSPRALVDVLRHVHRARRDAPEESPARPQGTHPYDRVREIFSRREQSLRKETLVVDRILDRMRSGAAPRDLPGDGVLQQSLRIACPAGGRSGGRFLVANETGAAARVSAAIGRPNGRGLRSLTGIGLRVEPEVLALEAGASSSMQVEVDLLRCVAPVGESIDVAVALEDGERRLGRIWIEVVVVEGER